jgi:hypothetical protein
MRPGGWLPAMLAAATGVVACSLAIGDANLESVRCADNGHEGLPACAPNQICVDNRCVDCEVAGTCGLGQGGSAGEGGASGSGGEDASAGTGGGPAGAGGDQPDTSVGGAGGSSPETGPEAQEEPAPDLPDDEPTKIGLVGDTCTTNEQCARGRCEPDAGPQPGSACTILCCNSSECPPGFVCSPRGSENFCVSSLRIGTGYGDAGTVPLGGACSSAGQCQSLKCDTDNGVCTDACCKNDDCQHDGNAYACGFDQSRSVWLCRNTVASGGDDADCSGGLDQCDSLLCMQGSEKCAGSCCNDTDCGGWCGTVVVGTSLVRGCTSVPTSARACCTDDDCNGAHCGLVAITVLGITKMVLRCP